MPHVAPPVLWALVAFWHAASLQGLLLLGSPDACSQSCRLYPK